MRPGAGIILRTECAVMDLPQPLSPTTPRTSPRRRVRSTPSTARTMPSSSGKDTRRSLISNSILLSTNHYLLARIRIGGIAHAVTNETEGHNGYDHECHGCKQPGIQRDGLDILGILKQRSPRDHRRTQAQANEGERGLSQNHIRKRDRKIHDNITQEGWQQVPGDDACIAAASNTRRDYKVLFTQREQLAAHPPRQVSPAQ